MTKIKGMEIEFMSGNTIEAAISELRAAAKKYNTVVSGSFNNKLINSDMTVDEAYKFVTGKSKGELEASLKKQQEEFKRAEEEHESKIPSLTVAFKNKARGIIREEMLSSWDEVVPIRLNDLYRGMELEAALTLIEMLDVNHCALEEAGKEFSDQGHSGMSAGLMFAMMKTFCIRGQEFVDYIEK